MVCQVSVGRIPLPGAGFAYLYRHGEAGLVRDPTIPYRARGPLQVQHGQRCVAQVLVEDGVRSIPVCC